MKLFGAIDIGVAVLLALAEMGLPFSRIYIFFAIAHAIKAMMFIRDILSVLDIAIVIYTLLIPFWSNPILSLIVVIFLFYKGMYSFA